MMRVDPIIEGGGVGWQIFKPNAVFFGLLQPAFLMVVRSNRAVDLGANRQPQLHRAAGQPVGVGTGGSGGPSDKHATK